MRLRFFAAIFALVLGLQSAWIIAAELLRPQLPYFPKTDAEAQVTAAALSAAETSAAIGWPRGDLSVEYALALNAPILAALENGAPIAAIRAQKNSLAATEGAAALSPSDARAWLMLAAAASVSGPRTVRPLAPLKMSYYTSPYNDALFPIRLALAVQPANRPGDELQGLVVDEIARWLRAHPGQKQPIVQAYRHASPAGRALLETSIGGIDAKLASELQTTIH